MAVVEKIKNATIAVSKLVYAFFEIIDLFIF